METCLSVNESSINQKIYQKKKHNILICIVSVRLICKTIKLSFLPMFVWTEGKNSKLNERNDHLLKFPDDQ